MPIHTPEWASVEMDVRHGDKQGDLGAKRPTHAHRSPAVLPTRLPSLSFPRMVRPLPGDVCDRPRVLGSCVPEDRGATVSCARLRPALGPCLESECSSLFTSL